jgi:hypothetical protein
LQLRYLTTVLGMVSVFCWATRLRAISSCRREWLAKDVVAGMMLSMLLARQGTSYAGLAGTITAPMAMNRIMEL